MQSKKQNKTDKIRSVMRPGVEYTTKQIETLTGIRAKQISSLMGCDVRKGWIIKNNESPRTYRKATDQELAQPKIDAAMNLLSRCGYTVTKNDSFSTGGGF